ncbi:hypothetical protein D3C76_1683830 [compost metagenome]
MLVDQPLGIELIQTVAGTLALIAATIELGISQGCPIAQATLPLHGIAPAGFTAIADQIELISQE